MYAPHSKHQTGTYIKHTSHIDVEMTEAENKALRMGDLRSLLC